MINPKLLVPIAEKIPLLFILTPSSLKDLLAC